MNLTCGCGQEATWYLVYGCEENQHVWDTYLCRQCLYLTVGFPKSYTIRNQVYAAVIPWTCMNVKVHPDMLPNLPGAGPEGVVKCEVTSWCAREINPDMVARIKQEKLRSFRERSNV